MQRSALGQGYRHVGSDCSRNMQQSLLAQITHRKASFTEKTLLATQVARSGQIHLSALESVHDISLVAQRKLLKLPRTPVPRVLARKI